MVIKSHLVLNQMAFYGLSRKTEGNCFVNNSQNFFALQKKCADAGKDRSGCYEGSGESRTCADYRNLKLMLLP